MAKEQTAAEAAKAKAKELDVTNEDQHRENAAAAFAAEQAGPKVKVVVVRDKFHFQDDHPRKSAADFAGRVCKAGEVLEVSPERALRLIAKSHCTPFSN